MYTMQSSNDGYFDNTHRTDIGITHAHTDGVTVFCITFITLTNISAVPEAQPELRVTTTVCVHC